MEIIGLLESAIGLVMIYLVLSLICSAWVEAIVAWTGLRGENLRKLIEVLCGGDSKVAHMLLAHPQLRGLYAPAGGGDSPPQPTENEPANDGASNAPARTTPADDESASAWIGQQKGVVYWSKRALALFFDRGKSHRTSGLRPPSYIPPERFARALADMVLGDSVERLRETPGRIEQGLSKDKIEKQLAAFRDQITSDEESRSDKDPASERDFRKIPPHKQHCAPDNHCLKLCAGQLSAVLTRLWHQSGGDADQFLKGIEVWFEDANDRATGWFKRKLSPKLFAVGVVVAVVLNVDTMQILSRLSDDPTMRKAIVEMAVKEVGATDPDAEAEFKTDFDQARRQLLAMEPLLGWRKSSLPRDVQWTLEDERDGGNDHGLDNDRLLQSLWIWIVAIATILFWVLMKLAGLLITAIALSLGAPFWFDVLSKLVKVRASLSEADADKRDQTPPAANGKGSGTEPPGSSNTPAAAAAPRPGTDDSVRLTTGLVGLAPDATAPDRTNARWMAELAEIAYANQADATDRLEALGLRLDLWMDTRDGGPDSKFGDTDTQGFIAVSRDLIVVGFRGTELADAGDVLTDVKARMTPIQWFPGSGAGKKSDSSLPRAHRGFQTALDAVWSDLESHLEALSTDTQGRRVWFVGHSLGGALAVLAAARYSVFRENYNQTRETKLMELMADVEAGKNDAENELSEFQKEHPGPLPPCGEIHTIGQPAVGDERFAAWLEDRFGERLVRTVNNRDAVPRLPTPVLGYAHAGAELYFDSFGRMKVNPGAWYRGLDAMVLDPERIGQRVREAAGDHAALAYIELLKGRATMSA